MSAEPSEAIAPERGETPAAPARPRSVRSRRVPAEALTPVSRGLAVELQRAGQPIDVLVRRFPHVANRIPAS